MELLRVIRTAVDDVLERKERLSLLEADAPCRIRFELFALLGIEVKAHLYNSYTKRISFIGWLFFVAAEFGDDVEVF